MVEHPEGEIPDRDGFRPGDMVVITGAAHGIGRGEALRLARDGARLALWDIDEAGLGECAGLCRDLGAEVFHTTGDVGEADSIAAAIDATVATLGAPYGLINNAGIHPRAAFMEMPLDLWDKVIRVNLTGSFLCAQGLARHMIEAGRGAIVNTASGRALQGAVRGAHYAASKGAIVNLTKTMALELAPHNIRVNCVIPGVSMTAQPLEDTTMNELVARGERNPMGRIGQPDDIAAVVSFLLSTDAGYMTGQSVACNGGVIMIP